MTLVRDLALRKFRFAKPLHTSHLVRCKPDLPINERFVYSVLFGFKYLLCTLWSKYLGKEGRVDLAKGVVKIKGELALAVTFGAEGPVIQYESGWEQWLHGADWQGIVDSAIDRHKKAQQLEDQ